MPDWLTTPWPWLLLFLGLLVAVYRIDRMPDHDRRPRKVQERPTVCAWCVWRDKDECTHPASPVAGQECGSVCIGDLRCKVREVKCSTAQP